MLCRRRSRHPRSPGEAPVESRPVEREALLGNWRAASCAGRPASTALEARQRRSGLRHDRPFCRSRVDRARALKSTSAVRGLVRVRPITAASSSNIRHLHALLCFHRKEFRVHTSVAFRNKRRLGSFGVTLWARADAIPASPPHPPDCSVPQVRAGIGALLHPCRRLASRREHFMPVQ